MFIECESLKSVVDMTGHFGVDEGEFLDVL
jgi:hypothetical protein